MAIVTGLTAARMAAIEAASVIDGDIVGDNLILTKHDGGTINAGNVRGPQGNTGATGTAGTGAPALQAGVVSSGDYALAINSITQITLAAGICYTPVASSDLLVRASTAVPTVLSGIPAAGGGTQRLDQVVVSSAGVVSLVQGTQNAATTLANRTGAAAIPAGSQLIQDVMVTSGGVLAANVRDRRPWSHGASHFFQDAGPRTWAVASGNVGIPLRRIEIGPASWLQILLTANYVGAVVGGRVDTQPLLNGVGMDRSVRIRSTAVAADEGQTLSWSGAAAQGSNTIAFNGQAQDGATTVNSITVTIIEHVRQNQHNGLT